MAKKSAKSKGFRKQQTKKPYLTKREVAILCVLVVLLIIGAVIAATYSDGALKVKNGLVADAGDNWLIVNGSSTPGRTRYFKVGEAADIEGYSRTNNPLADANVPQYIYTPEAEDAGINSLSITVSHNNAKALSDYVCKAMGAINGTEITDPVEAEANGVSYIYCSSVTDMNAGKETAETTEETAEAAEATEEAAEATEETTEAAGETEDTAEAAGETADTAAEGEQAEEASEDAAPPQNFSKSFYAYLDCARDSCVVFDVNATAETREALPDEAAMKAIVEQAIAAVTLEPVK